MKTKKLFLFITLLLGTTLLFTLNSCKKSYPADCYKGKVIHYERCAYIIQIKQSIKAGIPEGTHISYDPLDIDRKLTVGETIYFSIKNKVEVEPPIASPLFCFWAPYHVSLSLCK